MLIARSKIPAHVFRDQISRGLCLALSEVHGPTGNTTWRRRGLANFASFKVSTMRYLEVRGRGMLCGVPHDNARIRLCASRRQLIIWCEPGRMAFGLPGPDRAWCDTYGPAKFPEKLSR